MTNVSAATRRGNSISLTVRIGGADGPVLTVHGRMAWALDALLRAGSAGCTPIDHPAPRWSHYVFMLRRLGIAVRTIHEGHGGPYPGRHARYTLDVAVDVIERVEELA